MGARESYAASLVSPVPCSPSLPCVSPLVLIELAVACPLCVFVLVAVA